MSKLGRPTTNPGRLYSVFLPNSISDDIEPIGDESRSKRIFRLIEMGIVVDKRRRKK